MANLDDPRAAAADAHHALRALAQATRGIEDHLDVFAILEDLSSAAASLSQSLHQVASMHDSPGRRLRSVPCDSPSNRAATYQVSWELHRAGEILRQVAEAIDHAHEVKATITYTERELRPLASVPQGPAGQGQLHHQPAATRALPAAEQGLHL